MFAEFGQNNAWMNIDGRDVQLKLVKENRGEWERVGSKWTRTLALRDISVTSTYVATRVCAPNDETCESTDYDAAFGQQSEANTDSARFWLVWVLNGEGSTGALAKRFRQLR